MTFATKALMTMGKKFLLAAKGEGGDIQILPSFLPSLLFSHVTLFREKREKKMFCENRTKQLKKNGWGYGNSLARIQNLFFIRDKMSA